MRKRGKPIFMEILLCFILGAFIFTFQYCKKSKASTDQHIPPGIMLRAPYWSPDGQRIAFISKIDGDPGIYVMNADGSNQIRLSDTEKLWYRSLLSWSPDSNKIAFPSDRDGNLEVYIINIDGSNLTRLTNNPTRDTSPSWSPDGSTIVFESNRDGNAEIYIMNADGSDPMRLTDNPANDYGPCWFPDGKRIAFSSGRDGNAEIYIMNSDGSDQTRLTENLATDHEPCCSPDNQKIIFTARRKGKSEIFIMNADGSDLARLTDHPSNNLRPSWSPDGTKIYFISDRDFGDELYIMDADGSNPVRLTHNTPVNKSFGLAPGPKSELALNDIPYKIVFETFRETDGRENWEICQVDADGSNLINLTNTQDIDELYPHASPDGTLICFVAFERVNNQSKSRNVYVMNIDGTGRMRIAENAFQPCWSFDGKYIAYFPGEFPRFNPDMKANKGLEIYDLETRETKRHPNDNLLHLFNLCWSPDGEWFTATRTGGNIAFRANDKTIIDLSASGCRPDISSDGKLLVWGSEDWFFNIGTLNFDSPQNNVTDQRIVVACERNYWIYHVDWSPDGSYLAFSYAPYIGSPNVGRKAVGSNICICDLRTGKWTQITTDGKHNKEPDWVPVQVRIP